jgi:lipooligosaccharide transport system permease protein
VSGSRTTTRASAAAPPPPRLRLSPRGVARAVDAEWINYRQTWRGSAFSAFLSPLLYLGAIGFGLGSLVDGGGADLGATGAGEQVTYVAFLAPGLVAATGMQVATGEAIFGTMARIRWRRTWATAVETPMMPADLAVGHAAWMGVRGGIAAVAYALVTALLGVLAPGPAALTVLPAVLGGVALGVLVAPVLVTTGEPHVMNAVQRFVVIPMFLFSGVFFPVSQLPGWMEAVAKATPLWHAVVLSRQVALGTPAPWGTGAHLAVLLATLAVGLLWMVRSFDRALRP